MEFLILNHLKLPSQGNVRIKFIRFTQWNVLEGWSLLFDLTKKLGYI